MKNKLQTLLKHKLQWLLLLAALLGVSQGVWATIYFDTSETGWSSVNLVQGHGSYSCFNTVMTKVNGTYLYKKDSPSWWGDETQFAFSTTNWGCEGNSISHRMGWIGNNKCTFTYDGKWTDGKIYTTNGTATCTSCGNGGSVKAYSWGPTKDYSTTYTVTVSVTGGGTITFKYDNTSGTEQTKTATTSGLLYTTILKSIVATPNSGYSLTSLTVDGNSFTSGNSYTLKKSVTIAATFTPTCTTLTTSNYTLTGSLDQPYSGTSRSVTITPKSGIPSGTLYYTGTYYRPGEGASTYAKSTTAPTHVGEYDITYEVAASGSYCAANLNFGKLRVNTYDLKSSLDGWTTGVRMTSTDGTSYTATISSPGNIDLKLFDTRYITDENNPMAWAGKDGEPTITRGSNTTGVVFGDEDNVHLIADGTGTYTFTYNSSTGNLTVTYPAACTQPTVVTSSSVSSVALQSATVKGTITNGSCTVTASGVAYGTSSSPTSGKSVSYTSGTEFSVSLTGLTPGTKYYYRTYATTASGTVYGDEYYFTTTACTAPSSVASTQMAAANYCKDATATALRVTGSGGVTPYTYQWYSNTTASNTGGSLIEGATSQSFTPPTSATGDKYYYCVVKSAAPCSSSTRTSSVSGKIHVDATSVAGSITADASSVCNGNGTTLTLGSKTGNVTKWQKSITSSSTGFSDIANTTTSLSTGSLTQNTWYRAVVTNGVCSAATSTAVGVTVVDRPSITTQPASTVVACSGAVPTPNSISVVASGTDMSYQWQLSSTSDEGPWNNLSGRTTNTFTFGVATTGGGTYYYRCKITSATCSDDPIYTTVSTLTVVPNPTAGTISGSAEACSGVSGDVSLTLSGHTSSGTGIQWQKSTDSGSNWSNIAGATSASLSTSQTVATQYRAVVTTTVASCSRNTDAYSVAMKAPMALTSITLTPNTICTGGESTVTANGLVLSGGSVAYTSSATSKATVAKVSDSEATVSGVAAGNATIIATLSGGCGSTITKTADISVSEGPAKFTLTAAGGTTICSAGGKLRLSGSESGFSYQIYKNGSAYRSPVEGTGSALEFDVFESGDYVCRAYLTSSPSCYTVMTGEVTLHISLTPNLIPATPTVTSYTPVTITSINTDILTWEISGEGNTAYLYDKTSNTVKVKASAAGSPYTITATTAGGCSQTATLTVNADVEVCN